MIMWIARATGLSPFIAGLGLVLIAVGSLWAWGSYNHASGLRQGRSIERAAWEDAVRKLRDQMDAERRTAQARIDSAERSYLAARQREAGLIADLETAITAMEADNAETDDASCACRPALPRGLGMQLDAIGR